jgi:hypothetical protein
MPSKSANLNPETNVNAKISEFVAERATRRAAPGRKQLVDGFEDRLATQEKIRGEHDRRDRDEGRRGGPDHDIGHGPERRIERVGHARGEQSTQVAVAGRKILPADVIAHELLHRIDRALNARDV